MGAPPRRLPACSCKSPTATSATSTIPRTDQRDEKTQLLYFSGEAAFALAKLAALVGPSDPDYARWVAALDRALDYLTDKQYANLAGQFYFGEDHWTCMAADAALGRAAAGAPRKVRALLRRLRRVPAPHAVHAARRGRARAARLRRLLRLLAVSAAARDARRQPLGDDASPPTTCSSGAACADSDDRVAPRASRSRSACSSSSTTRSATTTPISWPIPRRPRGGFLMSDVKRYIRVDFVQHCLLGHAAGDPALF